MHLAAVPLRLRVADGRGLAQEADQGLDALVDPQAVQAVRGVGAAVPAGSIKVIDQWYTSILVHICIYNDYTRYYDIYLYVRMRVADTLVVTNE